MRKCIDEFEDSEITELYFVDREGADIELRAHNNGFGITCHITEFFPCDIDKVIELLEKAKELGWDEK